MTENRKQRLTHLMRDSVQHSLHRVGTAFHLGHRTSATNLLQRNGKPCVSKVRRFSKRSQF